MKKRMLALLLAGMMVVSNTAFVMAADVAEVPEAVVDLEEIVEETVDVVDGDSVDVELSEEEILEESEMIVEEIDEETLADLGIVFETEDEKEQVLDEQIMDEDAVEMESSEDVDVPEEVLEESADLAAVEAGSSFATASSITAGSNYTGSLTSTNTAEYYKFTLSSSAKITFSVTAYMKYIYLYLYDSNGTQIWSKNPYWNSTTEQSNSEVTYDFKKGTYYFVAKKDGSYYGSYKFKYSSTSVTETFTGDDNSLANANTISAGKTYKGYIAWNDDKDFYKLTLPTSGRINFTAKANMRYIYYTLYDEEGNQIWSKNPYWNSTTEWSTTDETLDLVKGVYYLSASKDSYTGKYEFSYSFASAYESFSGVSDDTLATANGITLGTTYKGQIAYNDEKDFYKFTASGKINVSLNTTGMHYIYVRVYDADGNTLLDKNPYWNSSSETLECSYDLEVSAGIYYLAISKDGYTGPYSFMVDGVTNGFSKKGGTWKFYVNGSVATGYTGMVNGTINGVKAWYYVKNGVYTTASGITKKATGGSTTWFYVKNGKYTPSASGIAKKADGSSSTWFYVKNGIYTPSASGIAKKADGSSSTWFYVREGTYRSTATGLVQYKADGSSSAWFYVKGGIYQSSATGVTRKAYGTSTALLYVANGVYKSSATTIAKGLNGSYVNYRYLVRNGKVDTSYYGYYYKDGYYYWIEDGVVQYSV